MILNFKKELYFIQQKEKANEELSNITKEFQFGLVKAKEQEQDRISKELHDGIVNQIYGIRMILGSLNKNTDEESQKKRSEYLKELHKLETEIRALSHDLNSDFSKYVGEFKFLLEQLIQKYPYSQTLKALLAKASENTSQFTFNLGIAAAFTSSRENLHHFIQHPEAFVTPITPNKDILDSEERLEEDFGQAFGVDLNEMLVSERQPSLNNDTEEFEVLRDDAFEEELVDSKTNELVPVVEETKKEEVFAVADVEEQDLEEEIIEVEEPVFVVEETKQEEVFAVADVEEQEVVEEIVETEEPVSNVEETKEEEVLAIADVEEQLVAEQQVELPLEHIEVKNLDQELVFESPIQTDFFAVSNATQKTESVSSFGLLDKEHEVTPYHDDTMPYTFLWWLNKTRKEHDSNLRPFVANNPNKKRASNTSPIQDSLNSQIAENIFHLKGVEEIAVNAKNNVTVPFNFQNKETIIIEKFIKEEPSIKPPAANKIDTENKAKKSSEDANDVVSETLAKIYVEQMLYHKALDVYKKLSLKFPEKSAYFASQIKYLELKVN